MFYDLRGSSPNNPSTALKEMTSDHTALIENGEVVAVSNRVSPMTAVSEIKKTSKL
jgi:hypothetical protein